MKTVTVEVNQYEVGDLLDVSKLNAIHKKEQLNSANKAMVISCCQLRGGEFSYDVLTNEGKKCRIKAEELGGEKYLGNIDLTKLFT